MSPDMVTGVPQVMLAAEATGGNASATMAANIERMLLQRFGWDVFMFLRLAVLFTFIGIFL